MKRNLTLFYTALLVGLGFTAFINSSVLSCTNSLSSIQIRGASKRNRLQDPQTMDKFADRIGFTLISTHKPKLIFLEMSEIQNVDKIPSFNLKFHKYLPGKMPVWEVKFQDCQHLKTPGYYLPAHEKSRTFRRDEFTELNIRISNLEIVVKHLLNDSGIPGFNWMLMRVTIEEIARLSAIPFPNYDPDISRLKPRIEKLRQNMQIVFDANYQNMPC